MWFLFAQVIELSMSQGVSHRTMGTLSVAMRL